MTNRQAMRRIAISLIAVQVVDIMIHVGTGQVEPIRLLSNAILGIWAIWGLYSKAALRFGLFGIALYLGLNVWFLTMHGITNPDQGDAFRVTLFVLVGSSTALALWIWAKGEQE